MAGDDILERDYLFRSRVRALFAPWRELQAHFEADCAPYVVPVLL